MAGFNVFLNSTALWALFFILFSLLQQMDDAQIQDEKHAIQKLLLNFEKHHGRPVSTEESCEFCPTLILAPSLQQSHVDKETMRPLYDRYRAVKRVCSTSGGGGGGRERENSSASVYPRVSAAGLDSTADTLPSVTLLQSYSNTVSSFASETTVLIL